MDRLSCQIIIAAYMPAVVILQVICNLQMRKKGKELTQFKWFVQVKTHLQSKSAASIAVGHQHEYEGTFYALRKIYQQGGILGLWRGSSGAVPRLAVGSASQLGTFYTCREFLEKHQVRLSCLFILLSFMFSVKIL